MVIFFLQFKELVFNQPIFEREIFKVIVIYIELKSLMILPQVHLRNIFIIILFDQGSKGSNLSSFNHRFIGGPTVY